MSCTDPTRSISLFTTTIFDQRVLFYNYNFIGINYENTVQTRIRSREQTTLSAKQIAAA